MPPGFSSNPFEHCAFSALSTPQVPQVPSVPSTPFGTQAPQVPSVPLAPQGSSNPSAPSVPAGFTGFKIPETPAKTYDPQGVLDSREQQCGILNLDSIASLKLNSNLDYAIRAIVAYRVSGSLDSLQKAIQYLNNELENNKTK